MVPILLRVYEGDLMYEEFVLQILSKEEPMKKKRNTLADTTISHCAPRKIDCFSFPITD